MGFGSKNTVCTTVKITTKSCLLYNGLCYGLANLHDIYTSVHADTCHVGSLTVEDSLAVSCDDAHLLTLGTRNGDDTADSGNLGRSIDYRVYAVNHTDGKYIGSSRLTLVVNNCNNIRVFAVRYGCIDISGFSHRLGCQLDTVAIYVVANERKIIC